MGKFLICDVQGEEHCLLLISRQCDRFSFFFHCYPLNILVCLVYFLILLLICLVIHIFALATLDATHA